MGQKVNDDLLPVTVNNSGAIFSETVMRAGFAELQKIATSWRFDYVAAEIRLHPRQEPMLIEAATPPTMYDGNFAGMRIVTDPSMRDDEIHVRDAAGNLLIKLTNLGKIRDQGETNAT